MPSFGTLKADTLTHSTAGSLATNYVVNGSSKAWADVSGSATPVLDDSINVSSIDDSGVGDRNFNLTSALSNTSYIILSGMVADGNTNGNRGASGQSPKSKTTTSFAYLIYYGSSATYDGAASDGATIEGFSLNGDLA